MGELVIQRFIGRNIEPWLEQVAHLRITVFREYPYLYEGDTAYERKYLATYSECEESLFVLAFDEGKVVGASTGVPLEHETPELTQPFVEQGISPQEVFYFGESVLLPFYRGRGVGVRFFEEREDYAQSLGRSRYTAFCAVERPVDHPQRPADYEPLDRFWHNRGYTKQPRLRTTFTWKELAEAQPTAKPMAFWLKSW